MQKRIIWSAVSSLMVLSLLISSCAKAPAPASPTATTAPTRTSAPTATSPASPTPTAPAAEKPKYGGVIRVAVTAALNQFDDALASGGGSSSQIFQITNEELWRGDWTIGPAGGYGSNEVDFADRDDRWDHKAGYLAESWKFDIGPETSTATWNIRKGVRWALNPNSEAAKLVNGREMTADDIVFSLKRQITDPKAFMYKNAPELRTMGLTAPDKYTVKFEIKTDAFQAAVSRLGDFAHIYPREVLEKYGSMSDWKNSVGTGAFILTEVVAASSATLDRNPSYWMKNPIGPGKGDQLPYLDGVKFLIIPDKSTLLSAIRTAKIDQYNPGLGGLNWEEAAEIRKTAPQVKMLKYTNVGGGVSGAWTSMRQDKPPFNDKRVRRAMIMAIDYQSIIKNYFGGEGQIVTHPIPKVRGYEEAYLGLDDPDTPASIKELYTYNPEKAKALLKEAGYPTGFKTWVDTSNAQEFVDWFSILTGFWSKIGVDVEIRAKETAAYNAFTLTGTYEQMGTAATAPVTTLYLLTHMRGTGTNNYAKINDPVVEEYYPKVQRAFLTDIHEANRLHRELMKYVLDQAWTIPHPNIPLYKVWWPWVKNYEGATQIGYNNGIWEQFIWLDQDLKKSMGY
ncbi:MAG: ABC transporter substrate-binding protein [Chloroflexi bacterium]|nr:ABC transporter substrate-binding protein [Chloroflexota bacterium]